METIKTIHLTPLVDKFTVKRPHLISKKKRSRSYRQSVGDDLDVVEGDKVTKTNAEENKHRRAIVVEKEEGQSWGFTLQSYGIHHRAEDEVELLTYVDYVAHNSPAFYAGMRPGDVILSIDGINMEDADHASLITFIKSCSHVMRMVVLFEDCCRKVDLHLRYLKLKRVLAEKVFELRSLEQQEMRVLSGLSRFDSCRSSRASSNSSNSFWEDRMSLIPELDRCPSPGRHRLLYQSDPSLCPSPSPSSLCPSPSPSRLSPYLSPSPSFTFSPRCECDRLSLPHRTHRPPSLAASASINAALNASFRSSSESLHSPRLSPRLTPSNSPRLTPSNSNQGRVSPSNSNQGRVSPSNSNQGRVSPSISNQGRVSPSISNQGRVSPSNSNQGRVSPSNSNQGRVSPSNSNQGRVSPSNSNQGRVSPSNSNQGRVSPGNSNQGRVSPSNSNQGRVSPSNSNQGRVSPGNSNQGRVSPSISNQGRVSPGNSNQGRVSPGNSNQGRVSPGNSNQGRVSPSISNQGRVSPSNSNHGRVSPKFNFDASPIYEHSVDDLVTDDHHPHYHNHSPRRPHPTYLYTSTPVIKPGRSLRQAEPNNSAPATLNKFTPRPHRPEPTEEVELDMFTMRLGGAELGESMTDTPLNQQSYTNEGRSNQQLDTSEGRSITQLPTSSKPSLQDKGQGLVEKGRGLEEKGQGLVEKGRGLEEQGRSLEEVSASFQSALSLESSGGSDQFNMNTSTDPGPETDQESSMDVPSTTDSEFSVSGPATPDHKPGPPIINTPDHQHGLPVIHIDYYDEEDSVSYL